MRTLHYAIDINAPTATVFDKMLSKASYNDWASAFHPSSFYEGDLKKGGKIAFVGISKDGKKEGMVARVEEYIPNEFVSFYHYGLLDGEKEITEGPAVESWAGAHENYSFSEKDGITTVSVYADTNEEYLEYFEKTWPKALAKLKEICEA